MLKRIITALTVAVLLAASLTSCDSILGNAQELMQAPEPTGVMGEIQRALYDYCNGPVTLKYPRNGENRTAFILYDLDSDGMNEAVAFYSAVGEEEVDTVHINIVDKINGEWRSVSDVTTVGNAIDKVVAADLTGDGTVSLLVGVEMFSSVGNQLNLFTYEGGELFQHVQEDYTDFTVCDLMNTKNDQLLLLKLNTSERTSEARLYTFSGEAMELKGFAATDGNISSYAQIKLGALASGTPAVFVDSYKSKVTMVTDVLYYSNGSLINPFFDSTLAETQLTLRNTTTLCTDINADGVTDIPFSEIFPGYASRSDADRLYLTAWKSFDGSLFNDVLRGDFYYEAGYRLEFPSSWAGNITVVTDSANKMRSYRVWDPEMQTTASEILRIRAYSVSVFDSMDTTGIIELARSETTVWAARIVQTEDEYAINEAQLRQMFSLI